MRDNRLRHVDQLMQNPAGMASDRSSLLTRDPAADTAIELMQAGHREQAIPLLERAAAAGDARAQYLLGVALYNGDEVAGDGARARDLLRSAAAAGVAQARSALEDIGPSSGPADRDMLVSVRAADHVAAEFARLASVAVPAPMTLESVVRELLRPLVRERLEELLPRAARRAVDQALEASAAAQARPEKS